MNNKLWYTSKTLWVNIIAIISTIAANQFGFQLSPEQQVSILGVVNILLRLVTKEKIVWE